MQRRGERGCAQRGTSATGKYRTQHKHNIRQHYLRCTSLTRVTATQNTLWASANTVLHVCTAVCLCCALGGFLKLQRCPCKSQSPCKVFGRRRKMCADVKTISSEVSAMCVQDSEQSGELQDLSLPDMHASEQPSKTGSSAVPCLNAHGAFGLLLLRYSR